MLSYYLNNPEEEKNPFYIQQLNIPFITPTIPPKESKPKIFLLSKEPKLILKTNLNIKFDANLKNRGKVYNNGKGRSIKISELKLFNFKTVKRENIDKKLIRKFRKSLKTKLKNDLHLSKFLKDFISESLFPPFSFEGKVFKSFNASYMFWIFCHKEILEYYEEYININLSHLYQFLIETLRIKDSNDKYLILNYAKNAGKIYSQYERILYEDQDVDFHEEDLSNNSLRDFFKVEKINSNIEDKTKNSEDADKLFYTVSSKD
jgi:hypothetical protein